MISKQRLTYLITACSNQQASADELEELDLWYSSFDTDAALTTRLNTTAKLALEKKILNEIYHRIDHTNTPHQSIYKIGWKQLSFAAAILFTIAIGLLLYQSFFKSGTTPTVPQVAQHSNDVNPGKNKATLTLADGRQIDLNDSKNGLLASQQQTNIVKTADGALKYEPSGRDQSAAPSFNTITVPRGGQYQLILPDGSKVWMNSQSSLRYPAVFAGNKREVELTGEAYFEIAHDKTKPFSVHSAGQVVQVLGTHFNINSYAEVATQTILLEGSILLRQTATGASKMLIPGQQASLTHSGIDVAAADTEESLAWKNGLFIFRNTAMQTVIQELERWYDVDITASQLPDKRFYGRISRDVKLSAVLNMLQVTSNIKFKITGRRVSLEN